MTVTENISLSGASVFTTLKADVGAFIRVTSDQYNVSIVAIVRGKRAGNDGFPRLHLEFIDRYLDHEGRSNELPEGGEIVNTAGDVIGQHTGIHRYTIGQRKGLPGGFGGRRYVVAIHPEQREVVIGTSEELEGHAVRLEELNWLADPLRPGDRCEVQIRYRGRPAPAVVVERSTDRLSLALETPVRAVTPGQSGVLYAGDRVLGGGVIA